MFAKTNFILAVFLAAMSVISLPAQAAQRTGHSRAPVAVSTGLNGSGGFGTGPYWQGTARGGGPIWRNGYYQGDDPDPGIRLNLMRDGRNYAH